MITYFQIAIDGPVAAGKSTVARELAKALRFVYVDTGAMYRAVAYTAMRNNLSLQSEDEMVALVEKISIDVRSPLEEENDGRISTVLVDGVDVSWDIRTEAVNEAVAGVAAMPRVREVLVPEQRKIAQKSSIVMEGRDITYVVLPEAHLKIYLTAEEEVRVERFYQMLIGKDPALTKEHARTMLKERDLLDETREASPLKIVEGAWVLDSSRLTIPQVVEVIVKRVREMQ